MKKLLILTLLLLSCGKLRAVSNVEAPDTDSQESQEVQIIDGRSRSLIDNDDNIEPGLYLTNGAGKELFEIVNFRNIVNNRDDNIKNYRGKIVILHFWATWCGYCTEEMKLMDNLGAILNKKEITDVVILPISIDNGFFYDPSVIKEFYRERNLTNIGMYQDKESKYMSLLGYTTLPTTIIIDKTGHQISVARGSVKWNNKSTIEYLEKLR